MRRQLLRKCCNARDDDSIVFCALVLQNSMPASREGQVFPGSCWHLKEFIRKRPFRGRSGKVLDAHTTLRHTTALENLFKGELIRWGGKPHGREKFIVELLVCSSAESDRNRKSSAQQFEGSGRQSVRPCHRPGTRRVRFLRKTQLISVVKVVGPF